MRLARTFLPFLLLYSASATQTTRSRARRGQGRSWTAGHEAVQRGLTGEDGRATPARSGHAHSARAQHNRSFHFLLLPRQLANATPSVTDTPTVTLPNTRTDADTVTASSTSTDATTASVPSLPLSQSLPSTSSQQQDLSASPFRSSSLSPQPQVDSASIESTETPTSQIALAPTQASSTPPEVSAPSSAPPETSSSPSRLRSRSTAEPEQATSTAFSTATSTSTSLRAVSSPQPTSIAPVDYNPPTSSDNAGSVRLAALASTFSVLVLLGIGGALAWRFWSARKARTRELLDDAEIKKVKAELDELSRTSTGIGEDAPRSDFDRTASIVTVSPTRSPLPQLVITTSSLTPSLSRATSSRTAATTGSVYSLNEPFRFEELLPVPSAVPAVKVDQGNPFADESTVSEAAGRPPG